MRATTDFGRVFQALPFPCALLSSDLVVQTANAAYLRLVGLGEDALRGGKLFDVLGLADAEQASGLRESLYAALFHGHPESLTLQTDWGQDGAGEARAWRVINVPLPQSSREPDLVLHCLLPPTDEPMSAAATAAVVAGLGAREPAAAAPREPDKVQASGLLVVIDDRAVRTQVCHYLRGQGLRVREAADVAAAIAVLGGDEPIDLIVVDTARDVADLANVASALSDDLDLLAACDAATGSTPLPGCSILRRPYTLAELGNSVHHLLRNREQRLLLRQATAPRAARDAYAPRDPGVARPSAESLRILLVEDDAETRSSTTDLLELLGHMVTGVGSAEMALDLLAGSADYDVLCSDLNLPDMSGSQLARVAREMRPGLGVVFASGSRGLSQQARGERVVSLAKPYTLSSLERALHQAMGT